MKLMEFPGACHGVPPPEPTIVALKSAVRGPAPRGPGLGSVKGSRNRLPWQEQSPVFPTLAQMGCSRGQVPVHRPSGPVRHRPPCARTPEVAEQMTKTRRVKIALINFMRHLRFGAIGEAVLHEALVASLQRLADPSPADAKSVGVPRR